MIYSVFKNGKCVGTFKSLTAAEKKYNSLVSTSNPEWDEIEILER